MWNQIYSFQSLFPGSSAELYNQGRSLAPKGKTGGGNIWEGSEPTIETYFD